MDPYVYPGTAVLKNLRDIRNPGILAKFEMDMTTRRLSELLREPTPGRFDAAHLRDIHRYVFQDVYWWAGEFRSVDISRSDQFYFAFHAHIESSLRGLLRDLESERLLAGLEPRMFAYRAAHYLGEINAIHPFRDGNGRAQRELIRQLALRNGHLLEWAKVTRDEIHQASVESFRAGDHSALETLLLRALDESTSEAAQ